MKRQGVARRKATSWSPVRRAAWAARRHRPAGEAGLPGHRLESRARAGSESDYLKGLGAAEVIDAAELSAPGRPLGKERWAGAVENSVGSRTLTHGIAQTRYGGAVACGLAQGMDLPGSVAPFILRGVTLAGIDSVMRPGPDRVEAWTRLARDLDLATLDAMTSRATLADLPRLGAEILEDRQGARPDRGGRRTPAQRD